MIAFEKSLELFAFRLADDQFGESGGIEVDRTIHKRSEPVFALLVNDSAQTVWILGIHGTERLSRAEIIGQASSRRPRAGNGQNSVEACFGLR